MSKFLEYIGWRRPPDAEMASGARRIITLAGIAAFVLTLEFVVNKFW